MGEWVERDPGYLSFDVQNCTYCGRLIPRHIWYEDIGDQRQPFCNSDCYKRYMHRHPQAPRRTPPGYQ